MGLRRCPQSLFCVENPVGDILPDVNERYGDGYEIFESVSEFK